MSWQERITKEFKVSDISEFKKKAWNWSQKFQYSCILENNEISYPHSPFTNTLAVGAKNITSSSIYSFEALKTFHEVENDWLFGFLAYDLKNQIEDLVSQNPDFVGGEEMLFFVPETLMFFSLDSILILSFEDPDNLFTEINSLSGTSFTGISESQKKTFQGIKKQEYLETIKAIKEHLLEGDIYEINYCIEFSATDIKIDPLGTFCNLIKNSPMPFSFFFKANDKHIICSSPERFLKKEGNKLISQPIKGTIRRGDDKEEDESLKNELRSSDKEISENMMIVDIVRNDLSKSSVPGSIMVEEMFGVYSFKQLHQMISTITSSKREDVHFVDSIKNAFPMGSMTGAPKIRAMELIEKFESAKRGPFSGAGGYFTPAGDFDLNVIIRSVFYNSNLNKLSFQVGSAITFDSDPESEYKECLLKAKAIFEILGRKAEL